MNAETLLKLMERGAILRSRWKRRQFTTQRPKMLHILTGPGYALYIQGSTISPLLGKRLIISEQWQGGEKDYRVNGHTTAN